MYKTNIYTKGSNHVVESKTKLVVSEGNQSLLLEDQEGNQVFVVSLNELEAIELNQKAEENNRAKGPGNHSKPINAGKLKSIIGAKMSKDIEANTINVNVSSVADESPAIVAEKMGKALRGLSIGMTNDIGY